LVIAAWVEQTMRPVEADDIDAHDHLLFALATGGRDIHAQLCPLIADTLLHQVGKGFIFIYLF
jgi:hypothetical protein